MCILLDTGFDTKPVRKNDIKTVITNSKGTIEKESISLR